nr:MAG TPA: hypothetical protein [Inoviridae sp.]
MKIFKFFSITLFIYSQSVSKFLYRCLDVATANKYPSHDSINKLKIAQIT